MSARDIGPVIADMLGTIPEEHKALRARLDSIRRRANYVAPELVGMAWHEVHDLLVECIGKPTEPWQHDVARIFSGRNGHG